MRKTTVVLDEKLLERARRAIGARTTKATIEAGLREIIRSRNREALRRELGTYDLHLSVRELRRLRDGF